MYETMEVTRDIRLYHEPTGGGMRLVMYPSCAGYVLQVMFYRDGVATDGHFLDYGKRTTIDRKFEKMLKDYEGQDYVQY